MVLETAKNQICINQIVGQKKETIAVEGDVIVNDVKPDVLNIISSNGTVCVYKKEVMDGKIRIDGTVNTYVIYLADDENGSVRSLNTNLDFTQFIDIENCKPDMTLDEDICIKNFAFVAYFLSLNFSTRLSSQFFINYVPIDIYSILSWTEEPGRLQSMGSLRVQHD